MTVQNLIPRLLVIAFALSLTASIVAQTSNADNRPRYAVKKTVAVTPKRSDTTTAAMPAKLLPVKFASSEALQIQFRQQLITALDSHVGSPYHWNRTGPDSFDCSGLVWRAFQDIGIDFQRGPARSYWAMFTAPAAGEQYKFGNLVFFSGLKHVGIVVDEKGFYHSARHGGVMYSPFNDYWLSRVDGFRRVPLDALLPLPGEKKAKPVAAEDITDERIP